MRWVGTFLLLTFLVPLERTDAQEEPLLPNAVRASEILQELVRAGTDRSEGEIAAAWVTSLREELGEEHPQVLKALFAVGMTFRQQGKYQEASKFLEELWALSTKVNGPEHRTTLATQNNLAAALQALGDLAGARKHLEDALNATERNLGEEHPSTLATRGNLAVVLRELGELVQAHRLEEEVLEARTRILGSEHAETLAARGNLAATQRALGYLAAARKSLADVLEVRERIYGKGHLATLAAMGNLAVVLREMGELAKARDLEEDVLETRGRILGEKHPDTLTARTNLATTLQGQGDLVGARKLEEGVLDCRESILGKEHPETIATRASLASILRAQGDLVGARELEEDVLEDRRRTLGEEHPRTLNAKANLAGTLSALGYRAEARGLEEEILEASERVLGKEHPGTITAKANLAASLGTLGEFEKARDLYSELFKLQPQGLGVGYGPITDKAANEFFIYGMTLRALGQLDESFEILSKGIDVLEAQTLRADYSEEVRNQYKARYSVAYRLTLAVALARDRPEDAFHVLERYRTQSLVDLLRWSRPGAGPKIPEAYRTELATNGARYNYITGQIDAQYPEIDPALLAEQAQLRRRREVIQGKILEARREVTDVLKPLRADELRLYLEPGTLLLAYSVGEQSSHLLVLDREGPMDVHPLETDSTRLSLQVERLRDTDLSQQSFESRHALSRSIYDELFAPAAERIARARRLMILPDGPLYSLHFAALTLPAPKSPRDWQYLVEHKPIHIVQSGTVHAELQSRRSALGEVKPKPYRWVGFGNPELSGKSDESRGGDGQGFFFECVEAETYWNGFPNLPLSKKEILKIEEQFPSDRASRFLGKEATEAQVRAMGSKSDIFHFATHALSCETEKGAFRAVDSFLALSRSDSPSRDDDGLLQVWEIIDHLQLDADLVVLSACVTALGPEHRGEGLVSLSRAFQIAGARSVLASLWIVDSEATTELMIRFYRYLLRGHSKDEALRSAQLELIQRPILVETAEGELERRDFHSPYHWAAFQLIGDWK